MLTCQQLTELVTDYLEGRLPFGQRMSFWMHVGMCPHCRAYLRQMKTTVRTLGKLPDDFEIPSDVQESLLAHFRAARPPVHSTVHRRSPAPLHVRALARLEAAFGGRRGFALVALLTAALAAAAVATGHPGPIDGGPRCGVYETLMELGFGAAALTLLGLFSATSRTRLSAATYCAVATVGATCWYIVLQQTCPMASVFPHVLAFHVTGVVLSGALGTVASRLPALR